MIYNQSTEKKIVTSQSVEITKAYVGGVVVFEAGPRPVMQISLSEMSFTPNGNGAAAYSNVQSAGYYDVKVVWDNKSDRAVGLDVTDVSASIYRIRKTLQLGSGELAFKNLYFTNQIKIQLNSSWLTPANISKLNAQIIFYPPNSL